MKGKGGHTGDVGRNLEEVADLEELPGPISLPVAFEDVEIFLYTNERSPAYRATAENVGRGKRDPSRCSYILRSKEKPVFKLKVLFGIEIPLWIIWVTKYSLLSR